MATIAEKLEYTMNAVDDIQAAINEKGVEVKDNVQLGLYGNKIREISGGNNTINDFYTIEKVTAFSIDDSIVKDIEDVSSLYT